MHDYLIGVWIVAAGAGATALALGLRPAASPPPTLPVKADRTLSFEEKWRLAGMTVEVLPRRVTTESIVAPSIIVAGATEAPKAAPAATPSRRDICRGRGRIWITKRKWRCKR